MDEEFYGLRIQKLALHEIFQGGNPDVHKPPKFNNKLASPTKDELAVLEQRVLLSLSKTSSSIETDIHDPLYNSVLLKIIDYFKFAHVNAKTLAHEKDAKFLETTKQLTLSLSKCCTKPVIPGGVVIIFTGRTGINNSRYLAIIKAEKQDGFTMEENNSEMVMRLINDLFLTQNQKLYKIAIFIEKNEREYNDIAADIKDNFITYLYDKNVSLASTSQLADYFYRAFLDWEIKQDNTQYTTQFYDETLSFINATNLTDEEKVQYATALHTYLLFDKTNTLNIYDFATTYFPDEIIDSYVAYVTSRGIPTRDIIKDTSRLSNKLKKRNMYFSSKVKISAPSKDFSDIIKISNEEDGITTIKIKGSIIRQ